MKSATLDHDCDALEQLEIKGYIALPDNRKAFSVAMILVLLNDQCPLQAVGRRTVQRAIADLKNLGINLNFIQSGNTPYYDRLATEMILIELKFKVRA